jgi:hypothetical protein
MVVDGMGMGWDGSEVRGDKVVETDRMVAQVGGSAVSTPDPHHFVLC